MGGEAGPGRENHTARLAVESVRSLLLRQMGALAAREEPPSPDEIACLALALHRIEVVDKHRLEGERTAAESAAPQAPRKPPSTQEMRALLGPAITKAFHPERLGSKPWEPWPDAPAPAEPDAAPPEPSPDSSAGHSAWGEPEAHDGGDARDALLSEDAHEERDPEDAREAPDAGAACEEQDEVHVRGAHDEVHVRRAQDVGHARGAHDEGHARRAQDVDDVPHIARPNRWAWGGELWPPEIPLDPSAW